MRIEPHRFQSATHLLTVPSLDLSRPGPVTVAYWLEAPADWTDLRVRREAIEQIWPLDPVWGEHGQGHANAKASARIYNLRDNPL